MNKAWKTPVMILAAVLAVVGAVAGIIAILINQSDIEIRMSDFMGVFHLCFPYLIGLLIVLCIIIAVCIAVGRASRSIKFMVRAQALAAAALAFVLTINLICFGPVYGLLQQVLADKISLSVETSDTAKSLMDDIADEGIVLLKNEQEMLPLSSKGTKLNVFGWASTNPNYGGWGSGSSGVGEFTVTLLNSLKDSGFELNDELTNFYINYQAERPEASLTAQDWTLPEPTIADYEKQGIFENARNFSDTAVIVLARIGGENADLPLSMTDENTMDSEIYGMRHVYTTNPEDVDPARNYLSLTHREEAMVERVTAEFDHVIVIVNSGNAMELGWVNEYDSIKSVLWMSAPGERGFAALGRILSGAVNPSGKLPDTWLYDNLSGPAGNNFGDFRYDNMDDVVNREGMKAWRSDLYASFVNYVEGIYVGYRYFETAFAEGSIDYDHTVLYPFGYGLSYTKFDEKITGFSTEGTTVSMDVTITNTGTAAGKQVAEIYYTPPYYSGGVEKSAVNLVEFAKTDLLAPGESQVLNISFDYEDMASYDDKDRGCYVLERGVYEVSLRADSHTVLDSKLFTLNQDIVYNDENDGARPSDAVAAINEFDFAAGDVTYLSRADQFANLEQATAAPVNFSMAEEMKDSFLCTANYDVYNFNNNNDVMPVTGAKNGVKITDMAGVDYDDAKWDELLDQMTLEEMHGLVTVGGYANQAISSIGLRATTESEGVSGIRSIYSSNGGSALPVSTMTAATWNKDLAKRRGEVLGATAKELRIVGIYAPSVNTHRTAFGGRNFEYYSEDGVLAGYMAANEVQGAAKYGLLTYIKHFALNEQETNRNNMLCTWSTEQAMREIYLKPFEIAFKEGGSLASMTAFNYIGNQFAGACHALLNTVLRDEWGFNGVLVTDWYADYGYMSADDIIRNGGDKMLTAVPDAAALVDKESATAVSSLRTASHNILYGLANSSAMDSSNYANAAWENIFIGADIILAALLLVAECMIIRKFKRIDEIVAVKRDDSR